MPIYASVEYVEVGINASSEPVTTNLTKSQDETQCTPFWSVRTSAGTTDQFQDRLGHIEFIDNAGTPAVRVTASAMQETSDVVFGIFVVEWDASITVQQTDVTGFTGTSTNVTITDVGDQTTAFNIYSYDFTAQPSSDDDWNDAMVACYWNGVSTTSVTLERGNSGATVDGTLYTVECNSGEFTVEEISIALGDSVESNTGAVASTVLADTFLIHTYLTDEAADDMRDGQLQADLTSTTVATVQRTNAGSAVVSPCTSYIQVVECQNSEWDVQRGEKTLSTAASTDSITAIDEARSFATILGNMNAPHCGRNNSVNGGDIDDSMVVVDLSVGDTGLVSFTKRAATLTNDIASWEVIQFASGAEPPAATTILPYMQQYHG